MKNFSPFFLLCLSASSVLGRSSSGMTVTDGVFSGITVGIGDAVPKHLCYSVLDNLEEILTETSLKFHEFTSGRGLLRDFTVVVPESWSGSDCVAGKIDDIGESESFHAADLVVTENHPLFGSRPTSLQHGQCGVAGVRVAVPYSGLLGAQFKASNLTADAESDLLLKEFVKYRFGVFEESGIDGDELYPLRYREGEDDRVAVACNSSSQIFCLLGDGYDGDVTTKQNLLCDRRSVSNILHRSNQLKKTTTSEEGENNDNIPYQRPLFRYSAPRSKLFVLVLDRSFDAERRGWEMLQMSLFGFISRLPEGSSLSVVTFGEGEDAEVSLPPTEVTELNAEGLHGRIPRRPVVSKNKIKKKGCLDCAMRAAFDLIGQTRRFDGVVVVATDAVSPRISADVVAAADESKLPVFALLLPPTNTVTTVSATNDANLEKATTFGGVYSVSPSDESVPAYLTSINDALNAVSSQTNGDRAPITFHKESRDPEEEGHEIVGNFVVEENLRRDLWISATVEDERDVEAFEVLSPTGKRHALPYYDHGMAYFDLKGANEPGIWSYSIATYSTAKSRVNIEIMGKPSAKKTSEDLPVSVDAWTEVKKIKDRTEVILYAQVKQGELPVIDADVSAFVTRPGRSMSEMPVEVKLRDSGKGYPDVTAKDGIYSAYFVYFSNESGHYSVSVKVSHAAGVARTPKMSSENADQNVCCGSAVPYTYTIPTGPFLRYIEAPSFYVEQPADNFYVRQKLHPNVLTSSKRLVNDVFPPSRVTDFKVDNYLADSLFVTLSWTAPGGDYDAGKAFKYEIRCYTNRQALRDEAFAEMSIPVHASLIPQPGEAGADQRCTVGVPWPNEVFYYAVVAFDEAGNRGKISNTVAVFIREDPEIEEVEEEVENEVEDSQPLHYQDRQDYLAYVVVAAISLTLVIITIVAAAGIRRYYRKMSSGFVSDQEKNSSAASSSSDDDDYSSLAGTLRKIMAQRRLMVKEVGPQSDQKTWTDTLVTTSGGSNSPTSDYGSGSSCVKAAVPSVSAGVSTASYVSRMQRATSQELPGVHKVVMESPEPVDYQKRYKKQPYDCESARTATNSTDCSVYSDGSRHNFNQHLVPDSPSAASNASTVPGPPPRISVLEDFSVYRDLSNMSSGDYLSYNQLPQEVREQCVPPYYDLDGSTVRSANKRHESLV